jgi:DNA mismatch repair protein MutS2
LKKVEKEVEQIEEKVEEPVERRQTTDHRLQSSVASRPLALGEKVLVASLNAEGLVTALGESDAEVQVGSLRIRAKLTELERKAVKAESPKAKKKTETVAEAVSVGISPSPGVELDIRGQASDDALDTLDRYLDQAYAAGLPFVRIIHGKGTGKLRQVVRRALRKNSYVKSFEEGGPNEGGEGVTVAKIG